MDNVDKIRTTSKIARGIRRLLSPDVLEIHAAPGSPPPDTDHTRKRTPAKKRGRIFWPYFGRILAVSHSVENQRITQRRKGIFAPFSAIFSRFLAVFGQRPPRRVEAIPYTPRSNMDNVDNMDNTRKKRPDVWRLCRVLKRAAAPKDERPKGTPPRRRLQSTTTAAVLIGTKTPKRGHEGRIIGTKRAKRGHEKRAQSLNTYEAARYGQI